MVDRIKLRDAIYSSRIHGKSLATESLFKDIFRLLHIEPEGYNLAQIVEDCSCHGTEFEFESGSMVYLLSQDALSTELNIMFFISILTKNTPDQREQQSLIMDIDDYFQHYPRLRMEALILDQSWKFHFIPRSLVTTIPNDDVLTTVTHCLKNCDDDKLWEETKPFFNFLGLIKPNLLAPIFYIALEVLLTTVDKTRQTFGLSLKTKKSFNGSVIHQFDNSGSDRFAFRISSGFIDPVYGIVEPESSTPLTILINPEEDDVLVVRVLVVSVDTDNAEEKFEWNDSATILTKSYSSIINNSQNISWKWKSIHEFETKLNRLLEALNCLRVSSQRFHFPQEVMEIFLSILDIIDRELKAWPHLNPSIDPISTAETWSGAHSEVMTTLKNISNEVVKRNEVAKRFDTFWSLLRNEEYSEDGGFTNFEFLSQYWATNYPEVAFYHLLNTLSQNPEQIESYAKNFIQIILTEPSILRVLEDTSFSEDFLMNFDDLIHENNVRKPEEMADSSSFWDVFFHDKSISNFLRLFYQAGRAYNSFYFKQRCFSTLLKYPFDEIQDKIPCRLERAILTQTDEGLAEYILNTLRTEEVHLIPTLIDLISNENRAKVFLETIDSSQQDTVFMHSGITWYTLCCLQQCESLVAAVKDPINVEKLCKHFSRSVDSTIPCRNLKLYYAQLREFIFDRNPDENSKIQNKLIARKKAEKRFAKEFYITVYSYEKGMPKRKDPKFIRLLELVHEFPYVFIRIFVDRLTVLLDVPGTVTQMDQLFCLKLFGHVLCRSYNLRQKFYEESFKENIARIFSKHPKRTSTMEKITDFFKFTFVQYHEKEIIGKTILGQFNKEFTNDRKFITYGGQANVYLVRVEKFVTSVIYKEFGEDVLDNILEELDCLMRLQAHPNIVHIYGYVVDQGFYVGILMQFCKGGSLCNYIENMNNEYSTTDAVSWMAQVACGIAYLHENDIGHRDIKPANILIDEDLAILHAQGKTPKYVKITDLGCATAITEMETSLGLSYGTVGYRAPEAGEVDDYTLAMDMFSIGRTVWRVFHRKHPTGQLCQNEELKPAVYFPEEVFMLMKRMMLVEPNNRPTATEAQISFQHYIKSTSIGV